MVATVVGEASQLGMEILDLGTQRAMVDAALTRMAVAIPLTAATEMAYLLHPPLMNADQHGGETIGQILGCHQDLRQCLVIIFLMTGGDPMGAMGIDLGLMIWIVNALSKETELLELISTRTYQVTARIVADR